MLSSQFGSSLAPRKQICQFPRGGHFLTGALGSKLRESATLQISSHGVAMFGPRDFVLQTKTGSVNRNLASSVNDERKVPPRHVLGKTVLFSNPDESMINRMIRCDGELEEVEDAVNENKRIKCLLVRELRYVHNIRLN